MVFIIPKLEWSEKRGQFCFRFSPNGIPELFPRGETENAINEADGFFVIAKDIMAKRAFDFMEAVIIKHNGTMPTLNTVIENYKEFSIAQCFIKRREPPIPVGINS